MSLQPPAPDEPSALGMVPVGARAGAPSDPFVLKHRKAILFLTAALCLAGAYSAYVMPASVFPQTDFPRVVILIDNGVMPADEMMATITRPVEEAMKNIPGTATIRSTTGRGSAAVNVFFDWSTDMIQAELYVLGRLAQIRSTLPPSAEFAVHRLTFSAFPIIGISLTSKTRNITELWEKARYELSPRFLRIKGVARVNIVGGRVPEYHVVVDPLKLESYRLTMEQVSKALAETNHFTSAGMHEENRQLYLAVVDNRLRNPADIENVVVAWSGKSPIHVRDIATVRRGFAPQFNIVTAAGSEAVLMNVYSQPDGNTVAIAGALQDELKRIGKELPPDMKLAFFYDQSLFVREGVRSVWECITIGLLLSVIIHYLFLRSLSGAFVVGVGIPVTVLVTLVVMRIFHMSFNLMTLGGIAAAIGMVIDDAIVVVEAIHAKLAAGHSASHAIGSVTREVGPALVGSTLTPVVVFIPLAFLEGVPGVFFRALAVTMVSSLLISLVVAATFTPALAQRLMRHRGGPAQDELTQGGRMLRTVIAGYEWVVRRALRHQWLALGCTALVVAGGVILYQQLETDFLPKMEEGAFVLDYYSRPGTSLSETNRMLRHVEEILLDTPEVESFSRRTGARLALAIAEPNTGDFLVKLRPDRQRSTEEVIDGLRAEIHEAEPALHTEYPGVLSDLIGDLTWSPKPCEIKVFSNDTDLLKKQAAEIAETIEKMPGVVDVEPGLVVAGPSMRFAVRPEAAARVGLTAADIGSTLQTSLLGNASSYLLQGDRTVGVRVLSAAETRDRELRIRETPIRSPSGSVVTLNDVAEVQYQPGILEMHREDLRQLVAVSARFSGMDLGTGIDRIQAQLSKTLQLPPGATLEFGGLFQQQQESFKNLTFVLLMAIVLVFAVLLVEFRSVIQPLAIVLGAVLALFGVVAALAATGTSLNIVSFLGAIIGVGIVAKNGILMLDFVEHLQARGYSLFDSLVQSGRRRLRPVLMTSLATFIGLLPLAYGVGAGADMLRPLAIAIIGALVISLLLSLVVTPVFYYVMARLVRVDEGPRGRELNESEIRSTKSETNPSAGIQKPTARTSAFSEIMFDKKTWTALALAGLMALVASGCKKAAPGEAAEEDTLPKEPVPVRAVKVERTTLRPSIDVVGTLIAIPEQTACVSPQIAGWTEKVMVVEGGKVRAGDELLHLDSRMAEAEHAKAVASVAEKGAILERLKRGPRAEEIEVARHDVQKAKATVGALRSEVEALKTLRARNEVSPVQFQKVQSSLQAAEAESAAAAAKLRLLEAGTRPEEIAEAEARLAAAKAELSIAKLNLQLCTIVSPIDGTITQLAARQGVYVERPATLATIVDLSKVFMQVRIPSAYLVRVKPGARVDVRVASLPGKTFQGRIARIGAQAEPGTGDVDALAEVANADGLLRPGLACRGRVWLPEIADALVVPVAAIADRSGTPVVSVVRDGKGFEIAVKRGAQTEEMAQVVEGLAPGDTVITEGGYGLPEGCPVRPLEGGGKAGAVGPSR